MRMLWKGLVLGAVVGGAVKAVREVRGEGDIDQVGQAVAKTAGEAALAGAAIGFFLDRRGKRRMTKRQRAMAKARASTGLGMAMPMVRHAADRATEAARAARPHVEHAAHVARPHVEQAADLAKARVEQAAHVARPHVEHAADLAKARAGRMAGAAKAKLAEYELPVVVAV